MTKVSILESTTVKRLCNLAQGCRVARLPWVQVLREAQLQRSCADAIEYSSRSINSNLLPSASETDATDTTPLGWLSLISITPG
jgi:hypothetical protein